MSAGNLKKVLSSVDGLEIVFLVEDGIARVDFRSDGSTHTLADPDDIIVFIEGRNIPVTVGDATSATAEIGDWEPFDNRPISMMIRVGEYFEGWELE